MRELRERTAVQEALARHKAAGNTIVIWRNGAVVRVPPEEIVIEAAEQDE